MSDTQDSVESGSARQGRRDRLFIGLGLLFGVAVTSGALVLLLESDGAVDASSITDEQARALSEQSVESISPDAMPNAAFELHHALEDGQGGLLVTGLVRNTSATFVERPEVVAICADAAGGEISRASGRAAREVLLPTGTSPIQIAVPGGAGCASLTYTLTPKRPDAVAVYAPGLEVSSQDLQKDEAGRWVITGLVVNGGGKRARYVQVQVLAYDAVGRIVGVDNVFARGDLLAPGETARFRAGPLSYLKPPERFEFTAYARAAD